MAIVPPTLVATYGSAVTSGTNTSFGSISNIAVQNGDLVVVYGRTYDNSGSDSLTNNPDSSGTEPVWTTGPTIMMSGLCSSKMWIGPITATQTISISLTGGTGVRGHVKSFTVFVWRNHGGIGVFGADTVSSPSSRSIAQYTLNGVSANSGLVVGNADWNATSGARVPVTSSAGPFNERNYHTGTDYVSYDGEYPDAGAAGNKLVGWSSPTGQRNAVLALEIKGVEAAEPLPSGRMFPFLAA